MKFLFTAVAAVTVLSLLPSFASTEAFVPRTVLNLREKHSITPIKKLNGGDQQQHSAVASATVAEIPTSPIPGMKPGTSGLRKKVEVWQGIDDEIKQKYYVENFIQSLLDTAKENNRGEMPKTLIVAGDGRYFNDEAIQRICRVLAGNGVQNIWVPRSGIMSTPAVSAAIRTREGGSADGGIILTASHNPGGPGEDFGIKYNERYGQPAGEEFTDALFERSLEISSFKTVQGPPDFDLNAQAGTTFSLSASSTVTIIDPFTEYVEVLKKSFNFDEIREFAKHPDLTILFDGMHGAGGPFAQRILVEELGFPKSSLMRCDPRKDFGKCHPDPNLIYAADLVKKMGLLSDGSVDESAASSAPTLGAANDGDGDRNLIAGAGCFVTPSDSLAMICDNWKAIPHFKKAGGPKGVARSMPSSAALDIVAHSLDIPLFNTPTGWKFFGNLMGSKEQFDKTDYTPFLCGEESFGTGTDHIREKDGLWAMIAWISILMDANKGTKEGEPLIQVKDIVMNHWIKYGRHFYCRYDYEGVEIDAADRMVDLIRDKYINGDISALNKDPSGIRLVASEEFAYTDPVDGSITNKQGLILFFRYANGDDARVVFRLSGTGSTGATIRMYLEKYEKKRERYGEAAPTVLKSLADHAITLVQLQELTGREFPSVIT